MKHLDLTLFSKFSCHTVKTISFSEFHDERAYFLRTLYRAERFPFED